ncbi:AraC family transcriptional regulator [Novosphingobium profundi]|uniref:AraC-like ligand-binding domain-containing protein n=1 Tax=Novosphingobium profundi TaxID=1774954 RepID=UPI001BD9C9DD|nr:AraC family transcriptional regulator [Novosphingobium profundi]MBT0667421.1 AraC family transcriptional regulator [Novosphingobium profundi]
MPDMFEPLAAVKGQHSLRGCRLFETHDVEDARDRISSIMQPHTLNPLTRGAYRPDSPLFMDYLKLGTTGMGTIGLGRMEVDVGEVDGYHLLVWCLSGSARVRNGREDIAVNALHATCIAPGERFRGEFSNDAEQIVFRIDDRTLRARLPGKSTALRPLIDLSAPKLRPWLNLTESLLRDPFTVELLRTTPRIAAEYESLLLELLVDGLETAVHSEPGRGAVPRSVRRAEEFIHANLANSIRLDDIAAASEVPTRTLLDAFKQFRDTSPMRYLRDVRLDAARAALELNGSDTVSSIALDSGFNHLGRFAQDYLARFGETPSRTRSRIRRGKSL